MEVVVTKLEGEPFSVTVPADAALSDLQEQITEHEGVPVYSQRICLGRRPLDQSKTLAEWGIENGTSVTLLCLPGAAEFAGLGKFSMSTHRGIEIDDEVVLRKTSSSPDSNNVLLQHHITKPCFVEFEAVQSKDEMTFGVTSDSARVERVSGFGNMGLKGCAWTYGRSGKSMAGLKGFADSPICGFKVGDKVAVFVDPGKGQVIFFNNGERVADNTTFGEGVLPAEPDTPFQFYAMVDETGDEIRIVNFGPGMPYYGNGNGNVPLLGKREAAVGAVI